jgi:hypothetical protein
VSSEPRAGASPALGRGNRPHRALEAQIWTQAFQVSAALSGETQGVGAGRLEAPDCHGHGHGARTDLTHQAGHGVCCSAVCLLVCVRSQHRVCQGAGGRNVHRCEAVPSGRPAELPATAVALFLDGLMSQAAQGPHPQGTFSIQQAS